MSVRICLDSPFTIPLFRNSKPSAWEPHQTSMFRDRRASALVPAPATCEECDSAWVAWVLGDMKFINQKGWDFHGIYKPNHGIFMGFKPSFWIFMGMFFRGI